MDQAATDPLLECLLLSTRLLGRSTTRDAVLAGLPLHGQPLTPSLFVRAADRVGLSSSLVQRQLSDINRHLLPAVLLLEDNQACVLAGFSDEEGHVQLIYPDIPDSAVKVALSELDQHYSGTLILLNERFQFDERTAAISASNRGHWFRRAMWDNVGLYRDVLLSALLINIFALALPMFTMNVYDRVVPNYAIETLWVLATGMAVILLADLVLKSLRAYFLELASKRVDIQASTRLMAQVLGMRMEFRPLSVGAFTSNLRAFETVRDFITSATMTTLIDLPFSLLFLLVIAWIAPILVIPACLGILVVLLYSLKTRHNMRRLSENIFRASSQRNSILVESLVGLGTLKAMAAEGAMQRRWERSTAFISRLGVQLRSLSASNGFVALWCQQLVNVSVIIMGVYLIAEGDLSLGGLIACTMLSGRAMAPSGQVAGLLAQYHNARSALTTLNEIMKQPVERPPQHKFFSRSDFNGDIQFKQVGFSYPSAEVPSLSNINLNIKAGEHIGILGRIGSGKTTLEQLVLKLFQPTQGSVLIDGIDINQIDPAELRRRIGYVPQDVSLMYGTLRDNITLGAPWADDEMVIKALKTAGLDSLVNSHPKGVELPVGERGEFLSGGQRKAVAFARALINSPSILVLDEVTAGMDHMSEQWIKQQLAEQAKGKTMLLITHSTSMMELVDRLIIMDGGRIIADGPRETIINRLKSGQIGKGANQ